MTRGTKLKIAALLALGLASGVSADSIDITFNNLSSGPLKGQTDSNGNTWTTWSGGSSVVNVVAGDIAAPSGTHYSPAQGGTAQSVQSPSGTASSAGSSYLNLSQPMSGTVWFSFLIQPGDSNSREGIVINAQGAMNGSAGYRVLGVGSGLFNTTTGTTSGSPFTVGSGNLVIGELLTGTKQIKIWVNPDVSTFKSSTPTATYDSGANGANVPTSVADLTPISYGSGTSGLVDDIIFSNDSNAEDQVLTGAVPEPATLGLMGVLAAGAILRRRRA